MHQSILDFIRAERIAVIAVEMLDGSPHGATVHFAHTENPFTFIFETSRKYRKAEPLLASEKTRASLVIGFVEGAGQKTFQMDGIARVISENEKGFEEAYFKKFPQKGAKEESPDDLFFVFEPTWWRFTDWSGPEGKTVLTSTDS